MGDHIQLALLESNKPVCRCDDGFVLSSFRFSVQHCASLQHLLVFASIGQGIDTDFRNARLLSGN